MKIHARLQLIKSCEITVITALMKTFLASLLSTFFGLAGLVLAFALSWSVLYKVDFAYSGIYDALEIERVIAQYGPLNRHRQGFAQTDKAEQVRLFAAINTAVHQQGQGLEDIRYYLPNHHPNQQAIGKLLHQAEIVHLQDVANLLDVMKLVVIIAALVWLGLLLLYRFTHLARPGVKQQWLGIAALLLVGGIVVAMVGPVRVFYTLHEWVFPAGHQWFFYYQDSLMSTLMKAPDLFGAIAVLLTLLALMIVALMNFLVMLRWR
jgi:uncharacterized membrane protein